MVSGTASQVIASAVSVDRLWKSVLEGDKLIPQIMSHLVTSVEVSGDGGVGTLRKFNLTNAFPFTHLTEKTEVVDHANHIFKYSVVDGGIIGTRLSSAGFEFKFDGDSDGTGTVGKLTMTYDTVVGTADLSEEEKTKIFGGVVGIMRGVEAYLVANPNIYA